ncbi:sensor histidine kinase [Caulobacter sp. FWC2]|uniref:sensor histidine kinase n=1 Tax=Caulobacter sp. FWC2 TaxID=69664 RepID=UPI000C15FE19|nr:sensor histidine kinase [Caulobacter sp. FWC2]PIB90580.1 sensor histidine kinase [Caulobacter sp. FWC2]
MAIDDTLGEATGRPRSPQLADLLWLSFLALYLTPWLTSAPPPRNWAAAGCGTLLFLVIFLHSYFVSPRKLLPHVLLTAAIGFGLAGFGGVWNVFNVLAAAIAGRLQPRRTAIMVAVLLQLTLIGFGLFSRMTPIAWVSGVYFGVLAAGTTLLLTELDRRNRQLQAAQGEIRRLTVAAERERIAHDLHDLLGRSLTAIALKANLARRLVSRKPGEAEQEMAEVEAAARETLVEVRGAVSGITGQTLAAELERAQAMLGTAGIETSVSADVGPVNEAAEAAVSMVLREAVTNVVRHAGAGRCAIDLKASRVDGVILVVTDDGAGGLSEGFGVSGMRRRARAAGGEVAIDSGPAGTTVKVRLPGSAE